MSIKKNPKYPREFQYFLYFYRKICELLGGSKFYGKNYESLKV